MAEVETRQKQAKRGATTRSKEEIKGLLALYEVKPIHSGLKEKIIKGKLNILKLLIKRKVNLLDPKSVWHAIDKMRKYDHATGKLQEKEWSDGSKKNAAIAYRDFAEASGIRIAEDLNFHKYSSTPKKLPFIPLESDINALIAGASTKAATFLQLLKETWARAGEAWSLEWTDIDPERNLITINNPEKNGLPRQIKVSSQLISMLNRLANNSPKVFGDGRLQHFRKNFVLQRKRIAHKLRNPRINKITFHTLRHWGATMEYHRTKDILHVKERLGHRSITSTLVYTHLVNFEGDEFHVRVAKTLKQDKELIQAGFEYVTERDGAKIYRKRK